MQSLSTTHSEPHLQPFSWQALWEMVLSHRRELLLANLIAVFDALVSVPVPLLIPLLVDEVLLDQPGTALSVIHTLFPAALWGPPLYIGAILLLTLLLHPQRVSMAEYETLGSGTVASHLVTDLDAVDSFIGSATSKFLVALLSIFGTAVVLAQSGNRALSRCHKFDEEAAAATVEELRRPRTGPLIHC